VHISRFPVEVRSMPRREFFRICHSTEEDVIRLVTHSNIMIDDTHCPAHTDLQILLRHYRRLPGLHLDSEGQGVSHSHWKELYGHILTENVKIRRIAKNI